MTPLKMRNRTFRSELFAVMDSSYVTAVLIPLKMNEWSAAQRGPAPRDKTDKLLDCSGRNFGEISSAKMRK
jgi:hypothetical protein